MAIKTVQAIINGQAYTLTFNSGTGKYEATITAPGKTSFNQPGGYYNVQVKATNEAGSVGTADASTMAGLKLVVRERVTPVITIISPSTGAYVSNSKQPVVFTVVDEPDGSGVDLSTLVIKQDGTAVASSAITSTAIANGYQVTYTPTTALTDGSHTVTVDCKDHDGNAAAQKATTYKVDTVPPTLNITAPVAGPHHGVRLSDGGWHHQRCYQQPRDHQHHPQRCGSGRGDGGLQRQLYKIRDAAGGQQHHCGDSHGRGGPKGHGLPDGDAGYLRAGHQVGHHYAQPG